jgi:hypothetical protein
VSVLRGRTEYGDSIEDEWVIVWLLREVTKKFKAAWIKLTDSDGEFLLIEAAGTLPSWLEPEVAENRVWINDGQLKILKPTTASKSSKKGAATGKLSIQDARQVILSSPKQVMHSVSIEEEAFYRLRNYPSQIKTNMHHAMVTVPRKIAYLLNQKGSYVAPAIEAFYLRDPIALKPLNSKDAIKTMIVPPIDMVNISVRFPKVAYAQLKSQDFPPPAVFRELKTGKIDSNSSSRLQSGIKLTCGFEMLLSDSHHQDKPSVREMKLLLDDLESGDESLPTDSEIESWSKQEDDEKWLDIDFADLEKELGGRAGGSSSGKKREFGDKAAQENLQRIVKQFEDFLNDDKAGPDGAGLFDEDSDDDLDDDDPDEEDSDDADPIGEDKDASFDEDEFSKLMQEMMGMPPHVMREIMSGKLGAGASDSRIPTAQAGRTRGRVEEIDQSSSDGEDDLDTVMEQMGRELREHGALNLDAARDTGTSGHAIKGKASEVESSDEEDGGNDIDINLAKNLLESFKAQSGMAGPGSNMMGLMGMKLPRDDIDGDDGAGGPSGNKRKQ